MEIIDEKKERKSFYDRAYHDKNTFGGNRPLSMDRDEYQCVVCESPEKLVTHHVDGNPQNNVIENLSTLCRGCHLQLERIIRTKTKKEHNIEVLIDLIERRIG